MSKKKPRRNLGCYRTRAGAEKRERQVQYFKHRGRRPEGYKFDIAQADPNAHLWYDALMQAANENGAVLLDVYEQDGKTVYVFDRDISQDRIIAIAEERMVHG